MLELDRLAEDADVDTRCIVMRDNGKVAISKTTSAVYKMGQDLVVNIAGIPGCYLASRVFDATDLLQQLQNEVSVERK